MAITVDELKRQVFPGESGGDYGALFGYSNRQGQPFANVDLTRMTVDQALAFSDPSGPYGQWVKNRIGRVATPMGAYQIVGSTLREAKRGLGLTGNEVMTPELQDQLGMWIYGQQGPGAWEAWGHGGSSQPAGGGGLMLSDRISTQGAPMAGLMDFAPEPEPQNWRERIAQSWQSGELPDRLTLALNSLRMRPDQGLAQAVMARQEQRSQERQANRTAEWLASMGRTDLAQAIATGALDARSAAVIAMTPEPVQPPVEGKVVGNNLVNPYTGQVIYEGPRTVEPNAAERDIALLQEIGLSRADAIRVSHLLTVSRDPTTGEVVLIDKSTGQPYAGLGGQPAAASPEQAPEAADQTDAILQEYTRQFPNASSAFGGPGFLRQTANTAAGVVGAPPPFPSVQETVSAINVLRENLLGGMALAYERQPNESLMQRIYDLTPAPGSPFESATNAVSKLDALSSAFEVELGLIRQALQSELSPALRMENQTKERELTSGLVRISALRNALTPQEDNAISQAVADRLPAYE